MPVTCSFPQGSAAFRVSGAGRDWAGPETSPTVGFPLLGLGVSRDQVSTWGQARQPKQTRIFRMVPAAFCQGLLTRVLQPDPGRAGRTAHTDRDWAGLSAWPPDSLTQSWDPGRGWLEGALPGGQGLMTTLGIPSQDHHQLPLDGATSPEILSLRLSATTQWGGCVQARWEGGDSQTVGVCLGPFCSRTQE